MAMNKRSLTTWGEFKAFVAELRSEFDGDLLFRGQECNEWDVETTLERAPSLPTSLIGYYRLVSKVRPEIESATNTPWNVPGFREIEQKLKGYDRASFQLTGEGVPALEYLGYLRHHGFPSPLLDWTRSPFVAAFFAFRARCGGDRAIFAFKKRPGKFTMRGSNLPEIFDVTRSVGGHKRHFLQRSAYTICLQYSLDRDELDVAPHDQVFVDPGELGSLQQDYLWKVTLPGELRNSILKELDEHNLNAFSLFATDEALMETLAMREIDLA